MQDTNSALKNSTVLNKYIKIVRIGTDIRKLYRLGDHKIVLQCAGRTAAVFLAGQQGQGDRCTPGFRKVSMAHTLNRCFHT